MSQLTDSLTAIAAADATLPRDSATLAGPPEDELLAIPTLFADITRQLEPSMAATAGEMAAPTGSTHPPAWTPPEPRG